MQLRIVYTDQHSTAENNLAIISGNKYDLVIYPRDASKSNSSPGS